MATEERTLRVCVACSPGPRQVLEWHLALAPGATVRDAVLASGCREALGQRDPLDGEAGVWGRRVPWGQLVRDGDRVELYRPLLVDPKVARRERFKRQGARAAGLFAQRRPGAKPGY